MIDRAARDKFSEDIRHLGSGMMLVTYFEEGPETMAFSSRDQALHEAWEYAWASYPDGAIGSVGADRLRGKWRLDQEQREVFARWILFLQTDQEYLWPRAFFGKLQFLVALTNILTFGFVDRLLNKETERRIRAVGDPEVWPFLSKTNYEEALKMPRHLVGKRNAA